MRSQIIFVVSGILYFLFSNTFLTVCLDISFSSLNSNFPNSNNLFLFPSGLLKNYSLLFYMNSLIKNQIIKFYNKYRSIQPSGRHLKFNISSYLDSIHYVLKTGISWRNLNLLQNSTYHYTTIFKFYQKLCSLNIFQKVYYRLLHKYRNIKLKLLGIHEYEHLYIDSTMIKNVNGKDVTGRNHYDRCLLATKLNVIIDSNMIPLAHVTVRANINDSILTESTVAKLHKNNINSYLIADKGYINRHVKTRLKKKRIHLIYGCKRSQKNRYISSNHKNLLKERIIIEHFFALIKSYKRLRQRFDSSYISFNNFIILCFCNFLIRF